MVEALWVTKAFGRVGHPHAVLKSVTLFCPLTEKRELKEWKRKFTFHIWIYGTLAEIASFGRHKSYGISGFYFKNIRLKIYENRQHFKGCHVREVLSLSQHLGKISLFSEKPTPVNLSRFFSLNNFSLDHQNSGFQGGNFLKIHNLI